MLKYLLLFFPLIVYAQEIPKFKLGIIQSQSGFAQSDGMSILEGIKLALDEINSQNENIEYYIEDDGTLPKNTVSAFKKLKAQSVDAVIGPSWSFLLDAISPQAGIDKLVLFNTSNYSELINYKKSKHYVFTNAVPLKKEKQPFIMFIQKNNIKTIAILKNASSWAEIQARHYSEIIKNNKGKVIFEETAANYGDNEWRAVVPKFIKAKIDLLLLFVNKNDMEIVIRRFREAGYKEIIFGNSHSPEAFNFSTNKKLFEGHCFPFFSSILKKDTAFYKKFIAKYNKPPGIYSDSSYDGVYLLWNAFKEANKRKRNLQEILLNYEHKGLITNYSYTPEYSFATGEAELVCIKNGKMIIQDYHK